MTTNELAIDVKNASFHYGKLKALDNLSLQVPRGISFGLLGPNGAGKTTLIRILVGLLKPSAGEVKILGENTGRHTASQLGYMPQQHSLYNELSVAQNIDFFAKVYGLRNKSERAKRVADTIKLVELWERRNDGINKLSGGMKQRAMIAMSLLCNPKLIIADEPTTALDVLVQDQILRTMKELQTRFGFAMILITHNVSVIARVCEEMAVMYGGQLVEVGSTKSLFEDSHNPYTMALLRSFPSVMGPIRNIVHLPGGPPSLLNPSQGCRFAPRCPYAKEICRTDNPPVLEVAKGHHSRCHFAEDSKIQTIRFSEVDVHVK